MVSGIRPRGEDMGREEGILGLDPVAGRSLAYYAKEAANGEDGDLYRLE